MGFLFEKTTTASYVTKEEKKSHFYCSISSKRDRKKFSRYLKKVQFAGPEIIIELTCFPNVIDYTKYYVPDFNQTLRSDVTDIVRLLNRDGYFVVAEVSVLFW